MEILQLIIGSGIIIAIFNNYSQVKIQNRMKLNEICEGKFRSILIFMDLVLYPERIKHTSEVNNPNIKSVNLNNHEEVRMFYKELISANISNIYLYADDKMIKALNIFLSSPSQQNYINVANLMRKRLWR